jgi:hypothetical protein
MPTKRRAKTPKRRGLRITPEVVAIYRQIKALPACSCIRGPEYWEVIECESCIAFSRLHSDLHDALRLTVFDWPAIRYPGDVTEAAAVLRRERELEAALEGATS